MNRNFCHSLEITLNKARYKLAVYVSSHHLTNTISVLEQKDCFIVLIIIIINRNRLGDTKVCAFRTDSANQNEPLYSFHCIIFI